MKPASYVYSVVFIIIFSFVAPSSAATFSALVHRYSFDTDAGDSVGTADGTLVGNASVSGGSLVLDGTDDWVELPGSTIGINTYTSATIETWFTLNQSSGWVRIFDFGDTSGSDGGYYWFYTPSGSGSRLVISTAGFPGYSAGEESVQASALTVHRKVP